MRPPLRDTPPWKLPIDGKNAGGLPEASGDSEVGNEVTSFGVCTNGAVTKDPALNVLRNSGIAGTLVAEFVVAEDCRGDVSCRGELFLDKRCEEDRFGGCRRRPPERLLAPRKLPVEGKKSGLAGGELTTGSDSATLWT